jgi:hypothetical protein
MHLNAAGHRPLLHAGTSLSFLSFFYRSSKATSGSWFNAKPTALVIDQSAAFSVSEMHGAFRVFRTLYSNFPDFLVDDPIVFMSGISV